MAFYFVGAYAASPCVKGWDQELERRFFAGLRNMPLIRGLEIPFSGQLHRFNEPAFLSWLPKSWRHVITCLPGTMDRLGENPSFGLASTDVAGRQAALDFTAKARDAVCRLNDFYGTAATLAVEIHSAPKRGQPGVESSQQCFRDSLFEIRSWDWQGASILVEHCDAYLQKQPAAKGFLTLDDEIQSLNQTNKMKTPAGLSINWARSAIEGRTAQLPLVHIEKAKEAQLLSAIFFSGCTEDDPLYGSWADSHAPFAGGKTYRGAARSILTVDQLKLSIHLAGNEVPMLGMKIQPFPSTLSVDERLLFLEDGLKMLEHARYELAPDA